MKQVTIAGMSFKSQKAALAHIRELLLRLGEGAVITPAHRDWAFLDDLLSRHPKVEEKRGAAGVRAFHVVRTGELALQLERAEEVVEGGRVSFSFVTCIRQKTASPQANLVEAMRSAVAGQVYEFKEGEFSRGRDVCNACGASLVQGENTTHADHEIAFKKLRTEFLETYPQRPTEFWHEPNAPVRFRTEDERFEKAWKEFHRAKASFQLLCAPCNMKKGDA